MNPKRKMSKDFGKKEFLLNYTNRRWSLTKTTKVGEVMSFIRQCQPKSYKEWESWYFTHAHTKTKEPIKITQTLLKELGERLYVKLKEIVIPDIKSVINTLTLDDCVEYVFDLTLHRTFDGFMTEKSIVNDSLKKQFNNINFEESDPKLDHAGDIDFLGWINKTTAIGIQIKPVTANANLGNYSVTARMEKSFQNFKEKYGGKVFIIYSKDNEIANKEILTEIKKEINRLIKRKIT